MAELVDLRKASKELSVSIFALRSWVHQRRLPVVRLGRRVLFRREDLEAFVKKNLVEARER